MSHTVQLDSRRATPALELAATVPAEVTAEMIAVISGPKGDTGDVNPLTIQANEQAQAAAVSASTDAGVAATKAAEASSSANTALIAATTATTKAGEAETSATNAAASATAAASSDSTATTKATEAATSATNAAASATTASTKATEASTSATNAAASATAAATSATNTANALVGERSAVATLTNKTIIGGTVNPTTLQEGSVPAAVQTDIGTSPNELPLNQYLGNLAYMDGNNVVLNPVASVTPNGIGDMVFQLTNDTTLVVKVKGSDGTIRSVTLTLA